MKRFGEWIKRAGNAVKGAFLWLKAHRKVTVIGAIAATIALALGLSLGLTLPVKSVEVEGQVVLIEGEAYAGGLTVRATTRAGRVRVVAVTPDMLSGLDPAEPGVQQVVVRYGSWQVPVSITVLPIADVILCVREGTLPDSYEPGDRFPTSGIFELYYNNDLVRSSPITPANAPEFSTKLSGEFVISLQYMPGLVMIYSYRVIEVVQSIAAEGKLYAEQGALLTKATAIGNVRLVVTYKGGTESEEIAFYDEGVGMQDALIEEREEEYSTDLPLTYKGIEVRCPVYAYRGNLLAVKSLRLRLDRRVYLVGEEFDYDSARLEVVYERFEGDTVSLRVTPEVLPSVAFPEPLESYPIVANYMGRSAQAAVRVIAPEDADRITNMFTAWSGGRGGPPIKGEELYFEGDTLSVEFGYGYREEVVPLTADMVTGYDKTKAGDQSVTITYMGVSDVIELRVGDPDSTDVTYIFSVVGLLDVPTYYSSDELVIPDDAYIDVEIGYGAARKDVLLTDPGVTITGFTPHTTDEQTLVISYGGKSREIQHFTVIDDREREMSYLFVPSYYEIEMGETLDYDSVICTVGYNVGDTEDHTLTELLALGAVVLGEYNNKIPDSYAIHVEYNGFRSDSVWIEVAGELPPYVVGVRLDTSEGKTVYSIGESLDLTGMKLYAVYSDDNEVDITKEKLTAGVVFNFSTSRADSYTATVVCFDLEGTDYQSTFDYSVTG